MEDARNVHGNTFRDALSRLQDVRANRRLKNREIPEEGLIANSRKSSQIVWLNINIVKGFCVGVMKFKFNKYNK